MKDPITMKEPLIRAKPGEVLVDILATFPDLEWLRRQFDMLYFLDFCCGLDALVIHEQLLSTGPIKPISSEINPLVEALIKNEVIQRIQISSNDPMKLSDQILAGAGSSALRSPLPKWFPADEIELYTRVSVHGIDLSVQAGFEELLDIPVVLWAHASAVYLWLPKVKLEQQALQVLRGFWPKNMQSFRRSGEQRDARPTPAISYSSLR